jgi:hypothetical protein
MWTLDETKHLHLFSFFCTYQCGVPKKGHICPYQPKLKRRSDEPPPELRNAAVQVEMDEVSVAIISSTVKCCLHL